MVLMACYSEFDIGIFISYIWWCSAVIGAYSFVKIVAKIASKCIYNELYTLLYMYCLNIQYSSTGFFTDLSPKLNLSVGGQQQSLWLVNISLVFDLTSLTILLKLDLGQISPVHTLPLYLKVQY